MNATSSSSPPAVHPLTTLDRYQGALVGLAVGDAIGTTVEFAPRGSFPPVTDMVGGGPFKLAPGQWTDDTSMALCLAESLVEQSGFDARDQKERYLRWQDSGYLSSTGTCFDIGITVSAALDRFRRTGDPFAGDPDPQKAGNGALMRLAPVVLFYAQDEQATWHYAGESTRTTHGAEQAVQCSQLFALQLRQALMGAGKDEVLIVRPLEPLCATVAPLADRTYQSLSRDQIWGTGYCVASLEAALWCFAQSSTFAEAVLLAANLGDDADTTAAICGQLAGAFYGLSGIPVCWSTQIAMQDKILSLAGQLHTS